MSIKNQETIMRIFMYSISSIPFETLKYKSIDESVKIMKEKKMLVDFISPSISSFFLFLFLIVILVCILYISVSNIMSKQVKSSFLLQLQHNPLLVQDIIKNIDHEILQAFENLKDQWILITFLISKSFLEWSLIIKSSLLEAKLNSNNPHFAVKSKINL